MKRKTPTREQRQRREEVDRRNLAIQRAGPRPKDGVTFGKQKQTKPRKGRA